MTSDAYSVNPNLRTQIERNLSKFQVKIDTGTCLRRAAVALVVVNDPSDSDRACLLLTRRPAKLNQHAGQYALPGGKVDGDETVFDAARRELLEELGLDLSSHHILGRLDDYSTRSGFCIAPIVIWGGMDAPLNPSPDEVAAIYHIPFSQLDSEAIPVLEEGVDPARPVLCSAFPALGHRMYSPTAAVMYQFREVALRGLDTRVSHYDQPQFAWR